jgi:hypothetical protein
VHVRVCACACVVQVASLESEIEALHDRIAALGETEAVLTDVRTQLARSQMEVDALNDRLRLSNKSADLVR